MTHPGRTTEIATAPNPRGDLALLALLAGARLLLHLLTSRGYGIFRDELYYLACTDHLNFGYVDHPPLSIALLWGARRALGDSLPAIRLLAGVAGAACVFLAGLLARALGGGRGAQVLAALTVFFAPVSLGMSHFFSMNAFDLVFWAALELLAVRALLCDDPRQWLWFGVIAGFGLQNKYSVAFLALGLVAGLTLTPQRRHLASPWMWLGGATAALLFAPHLWWQVENGWPSLEFMARASAEKNVPVSPLDFLAGQVLLLDPLVAPLWIVGLGALLVAPRFAPVRALGIAYPVVFALLVAQRGKVYYLAPIYPVLFAAGAVTLERFAGGRRMRWLLPAAGAVAVAGGLAVLPLAVPVLPVESFIAYQHALGVGEPQMERQRRGVLPQTYADMHGWTELVDTVARVYERLPPEARARAVVLTRNYGEAGAVDFLGRTRGLPRAVAGHNSYYLWGPGDLRRDDTVIAVGRSREELLTAFEEVEPADVVRCRYCVPHQNDLPVSIARGLRAPVAEVWPRVKHFM